MLLALVPDLAIPLRSVALWVLAIGAVSAVLSGRATPTGAIAAVLVAIVAASIGRLVAGTCAGHLSDGDMTALLGAIGCRVTGLRHVSRRADGVMLGVADGSDGAPLLVKIRGRDAAEGRRVARLWRAVVYRDDGATLSAGRAGAEGEALATLIGTSRGAPLWPVDSVGRPQRGTEVLALRIDGAVLADTEPPALSTVEAAAAWDALAALHVADIAHLNLQASSIVRRADGSLAFTDLSDAEVPADAEALATDRAQMLALQAALLGTEPAVASAESALDRDQVVELLPYLQAAAFPLGLRRAAKAADVDVDALREAVATRVGVDAPDLAPLRRITLGSLLRTGLMVLAAAALLPLLSALDWGELKNAASDASWAALGAGFVVAQLPRLCQSISTIGAVPARLPFGPVYALQLATAYLNIALPTGAARMALGIRFFQRQGVPPATSVTSSLIDSFIGNLLQAVLLIVLIVAGSASLDPDLDVSFPGSSERLLIAIGVVVAGTIGIAFGVPRFRRRIAERTREWWPHVKASAAPLRDSRKLGQILGGNIGAELLFAATLAIFVHAYGGNISLLEALFVNVTASLLISFIPVPGGIGVSEGVLIVGLVGVGVDQQTAFAAAISSRLATFYLPPIWGWFAFQWLTRRKYL